MNVRWMTVSVPAMVQTLSASTLMGAMSAPVNEATEIMTFSVKVSQKIIILQFQFWDSTLQLLQQTHNHFSCNQSSLEHETLGTLYDISYTFQCCSG